MKNAKLYIIAAIMAVGGVFIMALGFALTGFDISKIGSEPPYTEKIYVTQKDIREITVNDKNLDISFVPSEDEKIHITYYENQRNTYHITESDGGSLTVEKEEYRKWYYYIFNINFEKIDLEIAVPKNFSGNISGGTSNSSIRAEGLTADRLELTTSNNEIYIKDITAQSIQLQTSNDFIKVKNAAVSGDMQISTSSGHITLDTLEVSGDLICSTTNDSVTLQKVSAETIEVDSSNGEIKLSDVLAGNSVDVETSNDFIRLSGVDVGKALSCKTRNGDIKGTIRGAMSDFSITASTKNGDSNLPEKMEAGGKILKIFTANDDIDIDFED